MALANISENLVTNAYCPAPHNACSNLQFPSNGTALFTCITSLSTPSPQKMVFTAQRVFFPLGQDQDSSHSQLHNENKKLSDTHGNNDLPRTSKSQNLEFKFFFFLSSANGFIYFFFNIVLSSMKSQFLNISLHTVQDFFVS